MPNTADLEATLNDPKSLEDLYQTAKAGGEVEQFASEVIKRHQAAPENLLLSAWYYRLQAENTPGAAVLPVPVLPQEAKGAVQQARGINWRLAIALSAALSVVYWVLTGDTSKSSSTFPGIFLLWAPLAACAILAFLVIASRGRRSSMNIKFFATLPGAVVITFAVLAVTAYSYWMAGPTHDTFRLVALLHLPVLAWAGILLYIVGPGSNDANRFAALVKSAEIVLTGGIFLGAAMAFVAITIGLFGAIGVNFPEPVLRFMFVGVAGLIPVVAVALAYDPALSPAEQRFDQGLPKLILSIARMILPFALAVGVVYIFFIPWNFSRPYEIRDVLIVYDAMLFGVMGLLLFATPLNAADVPERWRANLRRGILALAVMAVLVSLYALSAAVYRTWIGNLTMNRFTIIGWNVINIALLCLFLFRQLRRGQTGWIPATQAVFRVGLLAYGVWTTILLIALPILFP